MNIRKKYGVILFLILFLILLFTSCANICTTGFHDGQTTDLKVHYIDVGQGDSILIQKDGETMLIDAGDNESGKVVVDYLKKNHVSKIDYLIGTHPHSDHIGGLDTVIENFDIGKVMMPKVTHTSKTFEDVLLALKKKDLKLILPKAEDTYGLGDAKWKILAPNGEEYDNFNNYSLVIQLLYKNNSFLFTGDAESQSEKEILQANKKNSLISDVLKIGHHGSSTSTTDEFLQAIQPKVAVISLGKENSYGHPHKEILEKLKKNQVTIFRTDLNGTIIATSDGEQITFEIEKKQEVNKENGETLYIGNKNTKVLHTKNCNQLPAKQNQIYFKNKEQAFKQGYRLHEACQP